jgi:hypothetical protein
MSRGKKNGFNQGKPTKIRVCDDEGKVTNKQKGRSQVGSVLFNYLKASSN